MGREHLAHRAKVMRQQQVVGVQKADDIAPGAADARVARRREAAVGLRVHADPRIGEPVRHVAGSIAGAVVDDHHLEV